MQIHEYDRDKAVAYAYKWAFDRNPDFYDFSDIGGDCTNFASQCVYAGAGIMNFTPTFGWFFRTANDRTASWTGVEYFYNFMVGNADGIGDGAGPFMEVVPLEKVLPGDIIQLKFHGMERFSHTPVVVSVGSCPKPGNILLAAHSYDAFNRPLNTYDFEECRALHVLGVRSKG